MEGREGEGKGKDLGNGREGWGREGKGKRRGKGGEGRGIRTTPTAFWANRILLSKRVRCDKMKKKFCPDFYIIRKII